MRTYGIQMEGVNNYFYNLYLWDWEKKGFNSDGEECFVGLRLLNCHAPYEAVLKLLSRESREVLFLLTKFHFDKKGEKKTDNWFYDRLADALLGERPKTLKTRRSIVKQRLASAFAELAETEPPQAFVDYVIEEERRRAKEDDIFEFGMGHRMRRPGTHYPRKLVFQDVWAEEPTAYYSPYKSYL
ncbi:hypothetical protein FWH30_00225 [Microgenomates group bacterium]|nr:hypothetical protein [Microgenomates group bacterium]